MNDTNHPFGETIFAYTRKQAIADGVLVDLSQFPELKQTWKWNVACTDTVWNLIDAAIRNDGKDLAGVLWDLTNMMRFAARRTPETDSILFRVIIGRTTHQLKLHVGPGDCGEPVITVMLPNED